MSSDVTVREIWLMTVVELVGLAEADVNTEPCVEGATWTVRVVVVSVVSAGLDEPDRVVVAAVAAEVDMFLEEAMVELDGPVVTGTTSSPLGVVPRAKPININTTQSNSPKEDRWLA